MFGHWSDGHQSVKPPAPLPHLPAQAMRPLCSHISQSWLEYWPWTSEAGLGNPISAACPDVGCFRNNHQCVEQWREIRLVPHPNTPCKCIPFLSLVHHCSTDFAFFSVKKDRFCGVCFSRVRVWHDLTRKERKDVLLQPVQQILFLQQLFEQLACNCT